MPLPAYDYVIKCCNTFNILDTRGAVSISERVKLFASMRGLTHEIVKLINKLEIKSTDDNENRTIVNNGNIINSGEIQYTNTKDI